MLHLLRVRATRLRRSIVGWLARVHDRVVCFLRGHTPRRRTNYVFCGSCGYLHQRNED